MSDAGVEVAGVASHIAKSGRLIIKMQKPLNAGTILVDAKNKQVARIAELIGPVSSPYASATLLKKKGGISLGTELYVSRSVMRNVDE